MLPIQESVGNASAVWHKGHQHAANPSKCCEAINEGF